MSARAFGISRATTQASNLDGQISLTDNTVTKSFESIAEDDDVDRPVLLTSNTSASQRLGRRRLREEIARRKYAKYQQDRYDDEDPEAESAPATRMSTATASTEPEEGLNRQSTSRTGISSKGRSSTFRRGQNLVKGLIGRKKNRYTIDGDEEVDLLFENQRGNFFLGIPFYSSKSLLNFDPPAWTNIYGQPSSVNIFNAQVPDPSWEWAWKTWYVDMSGDVDEQGWQYSFMFQKNFSWHGTHPWLHSFVRRRRWIRKRVRTLRHLPDGKAAGARTMHEAHKLNADYFTIHPARERSPDSSYGGSLSAPPSTAQRNNQAEEEASDDIDNIRVLLQRVKKATVDREKINAVLKFMDQGGQDVYYLADEISHILSMFLFQYSRRHLLTLMLRKIEGKPPQPKEDPDQDEDDTPQLSEKDEKTATEEAQEESQEGDDRTRRKKSLRRAVEAADREIARLEYWSDIRRVVEKGDSITAVDEDQGWGEGFRGLDLSGPARPEHDAHSSKDSLGVVGESEEQGSEKGSVGTKDKGKAKA